MNAMANKIGVTYANGAFAPDREVSLREGAKAWMWFEERFAPSLPCGSPLGAAERRFELAFANGVWNETEVREGCRLAWNAAKDAIARIAGQRGWAHETIDDLRDAIRRLDAGERVDVYGGKFLFAMMFYHCAEDEIDDYALIIFEDIRGITDALIVVQALIDMLAGKDAAAS